jgi:hypothetical protein
LYIFTGLIAGIMIGFFTALVIQNRSFQEMMPIFGGDHDTLGLSDQTKQDGFVQKSKKRGVQKTDTPADDMMPDEPFSGIDSADFYGTEGDTLTEISSDGTGMVYRDEMIATKSIKLTIVGDNYQKRTTGTSDSLLTALTGAKPPEGFHPEYTLEFWRNPVNYKGYKLIRNRIILFGQPPDQPYQLLYANSQLVLSVKNTQYILRESSDFLPLIPRKQQ